MRDYKDEIYCDVLPMDVAHVLFEALRFRCVIVYVFVDGHLSLFRSKYQHSEPTAMAQAR